MSNTSTTKRVLAAPFQQKSTTSRSTDGSSTSSRNSAAQDFFTDDVIDFRNFQFKALEPLKSLQFVTYCGPTPESNWVIPGVLLVGAYPASEHDDETFDLLTSILQLGITKFVCLQSEYKANATVHQWKTGAALRPYYNDVREIVAHKREIEELRPFLDRIVDIENLSFDHCPIVDCGITDDDKVLTLARKLVKDISEGEVLYLHCWGGHGRTGTLVCIMLHLMYGLNATQAMHRCQTVHDMRTCPVAVGSPQTQSQCNQVRRVIQFLQKGYKIQEEIKLKEQQLQREREEKELKERQEKERIEKQKREKERLQQEQQERTNALRRSSSKQLINESSTATKSLDVEQETRPPESASGKSTGSRSVKVKKSNIATKAFNAAASVLTGIGSGKNGGSEKKISSNNNKRPSSGPVTRSATIAANVASSKKMESKNPSSQASQPLSDKVIERKPSIPSSQSSVTKTIKRKESGSRSAEKTEADMIDFPSTFAKPVDSTSTDDYSIAGTMGDFGRSTDESEYGSIQSSLHCVTGLNSFNASPSMSANASLQATPFGSFYDVKSSAAAAAAVAAHAAKSLPSKQKAINALVVSDDESSEIDNMDEQAKASASGLLFKSQPENAPDSSINSKKALHLVPLGNSSKSADEMETVEGEAVPLEHCSATMSTSVDEGPSASIVGATDVEDESMLSSRSVELQKLAEADLAKEEERKIMRTKKSGIAGVCLPSPQISPTATSISTDFFNNTVACANEKISDTEQRQFDHASDSMPVISVDSLEVKDEQQRNQSGDCSDDDQPVVMELSADSMEKQMGTIKISSLSTDGHAALNTQGASVINSEHDQRVPSVLDGSYQETVFTSVEQLCSDEAASGKQTQSVDHVFSKVQSTAVNEGHEGISEDYASAMPSKKAVDDVLAALSASISKPIQSLRNEKASTGRIPVIQGGKGADVSAAPESGNENGNSKASLPVGKVSSSTRENSVNAAPQKPPTASKSLNRTGSANGSVVKSPSNQKLTSSTKKLTPSPPSVPNTSSRQPSSNANRVKSNVASKYLQNLPSSRDSQESDTAVKRTSRSSSQPRHSVRSTAQKDSGAQKSSKEITGNESVNKALQTAQNFLQATGKSNTTTPSTTVFRVPSRGKGGSSESRSRSNSASRGRRDSSTERLAGGATGSNKLQKVETTLNRSSSSGSVAADVAAARAQKSRVRSRSPTKTISLPDAVDPNGALASNGCDYSSYGKHASLDANNLVTPVANFVNPLHSTCANSAHQKASRNNQDAVDVTPGVPASLSSFTTGTHSNNRSATVGTAAIPAISAAMATTAASAMVLPRRSAFHHTRLAGKKTRNGASLLAAVTATSAAVDAKNKESAGMPSTDMDVDNGEAIATPNIGNNGKHPTPPSSRVPTTRSRPVQQRGH